MPADDTVHILVDAIALVGALTAFLHLVYDAIYAYKHDQPLPPSETADKSK